MHKLGTVDFICNELEIDTKSFTKCCSLSKDNNYFNFLQLQLDQQADIPIGKWNWTSLDDNQSHLLQGVRLSTEFINSLMWYATLSNLTKYAGSARVMDTRIFGTISYDPPVIRYKKQLWNFRAL